jgi:hypothetical protein
VRCLPPPEITEDERASTAFFSNLADHSRVARRHRACSASRKSGRSAERRDHDGGNGGKGGRPPPHERFPREIASSRGSDRPPSRVAGRWQDGGRTVADGGRRWQTLAGVIRRSGGANVWGAVKDRPCAGRRSGGDPGERFTVSERYSAMHFSLSFHSLSTSPPPAPWEVRMVRDAAGRWSDGVLMVRRFSALRVLSHGESPLIAADAAGERELRAAVVSARGGRTGCGPHASPLMTTPTAWSRS